MKLLLINTCGAEGVLALADDERVVAEERLPGRGASEMLMPALRRLLGTPGWTPGELGGVGVVVGPGSFTGVRVGLSAAKGLCDALGVGMVAMSRLALVAMQARGDGAVALLDAGRGEYFCGVYRRGMRVSEELLRAEEVLGLVRRGEAVRGEAVRGEAVSGEAVTCEARVQEVLEEVRLMKEPGAVEMLAMALERIGAGEWSDVAATDANYLRRTDAELLKGTVRP